MDIKNLKELAEFVLDIGVGVSKSLVDGKVSLSDAFNFKDAMFSVLPAFKNISEVDEEYFDMDAGEKEELKAFVAQKLELDPSHHDVEVIVENVLGVIIELNALIGQLVGANAPKP